MQLAKDYGETIRRRAKSLLVPMGIWNLAMLAAMVAYPALTHDYSELPASPGAAVNALLALTAQPANLPLGFLRDLFVVMLLSPLLVAGIRRAGVWFVLLVFVVAALLPHSVILLRTQIAFFFTLGIWLHVSGFRTLPRGVVIACLIWSVGSFGTDMMQVAQGMPVFHTTVREAIDRMAIAALFWKLATLLIERPSGALVASLEPYAFIAFCSHFPLFRALSIIGIPIFGDMRSPLYPIYFVLQPVLGFVLAVVIVQLLQPWPGVLRVLNAGKAIGPFALPKSWTFARRASIGNDHDR